MKRISRREFNLLAVAGAAVAAPLGTAGASPSRAGQEPTPDEKPKKKPALTTEQEKKVEEEVAKREEQLGAIRNRTLPYGLEPAFVFQVKAIPHTAPVQVRRKD